MAITICCTAVNGVRWLSRIATAALLLTVTAVAGAGEFNQVIIDEDVGGRTAIEDVDG